MQRLTLIRHALTEWNVRGALLHVLATGTPPATAPCYPRAMELTAKSALVTGASRGIGRAVALGLVRAGIHVTVTARHEDAIETAAREIGA
ncbi:MAG: SDR family NAD(P)-dependent oxidoreductase, partial [Deinococcales bacterium]